MESKYDATDEEIICEDKGTPEDIEFDTVVGALEELLMSEQFTAIQESFFAAHCSLFADTDENKREYLAVFEEYKMVIERAIDSLVSSKIPTFSMSRFEDLLSRRPEDELSGEIFDLLLSLGDFQEFKDTILNYKRMHRAGADHLELSGQHIDSVPNSP